VPVTRELSGGWIRHGIWGLADVRGASRASATRRGGLGTREW
jgi:hypothetical protein